MKEMVLSEPLIDCVYEKNVCTNMVPIFAIDLYTVKIEDLNFNAQVQLPVLRNDYCHAMVAFFEVEFTKCYRPTGFSTGPHCRRTHWKQTIFYLTNDLAVSRGTIIDVFMSVSRNLLNKRSLEISMEVDYKDSSENPSQKRLYAMR